MRRREPARRAFTLSEARQLILLVTQLRALMAAVAERRQLMTGGMR
jgi:hypothetical protein